MESHRTYPRLKCEDELVNYKASYNHSVKLGCRFSRFSHIQLFVTPWPVAHKAPLSMEFSRQEYWSGLPFPLQEIFQEISRRSSRRSPGDLPDPGIEPGSPALQADSLPSEPPGKPHLALPFNFPRPRPQLANFFLTSTNTYLISIRFFLSAEWHCSVPRNRTKRG